MRILLTMSAFLTQHLIVMHAGGVAAKLKSIFLLAMLTSPMPFFIENVADWTVTNSTYVSFVFGAIILDHILGSFIHFFMKHDFSLKKNVVGLVTKVGLVLAVGFLFEGINHIIQGDNLIKDYLVIVLRLLVFMYPAGSAFVNSSIATNGKFPPRGFLDKLAKFQKSLNVKDLSNQEKE